MDVPPLAGVAEVADMLGVTRQRASQLHRDHPRFPAPAVVLRMGPVWTRTSILEFAADWSRKPGRPPHGR